MGHSAEYAPELAQPRDKGTGQFLPQISIIDSGLLQAQGEGPLILQNFWTTLCIPLVTQESLWTESLLSLGCCLTHEMRIVSAKKVLVGQQQFVLLEYHEYSLIKVSYFFHTCDAHWVMLSWIKICRGMNSILDFVFLKLMCLLSCSF